MDAPAESRKRGREPVTTYEADSEYNFPAPTIRAPAPSIYQPGNPTPVAKMTLAEVVAEENEKLFGCAQPQLALWANPFPRVPNMPLYSWEFVSTPAGNNELRFWYSRSPGWNTASICDRLYHVTPHGFQFPILASPAPTLPSLRPRCQLVVCPCASDDFALYARVMGFLWDAVRESTELSSLAPFSRSWKFNRTYVDWRTFHKNREMIHVKLMWYLDSRITHIEFWNDMSKFIIEKPWDLITSFPGINWADEVGGPVTGPVELVYDAVYWPIKPPPGEDEYEFYDRIRFLPVTWSDL